MSYFDDNEDYLTGLPYRKRRHNDKPHTVTCRNCGREGLHWGDDGDGNAVLMEGSFKVHKCKQADVDALQTADFENLDKK